jgi:hypothetical protein
MDTSLDSLRTCTAGAALGLVFIVGVVSFYIQLVTHRTYFPVVGVASVGLLAVWWFVQGRQFSNRLASKDVIFAFCLASVAVVCLADTGFRVTNAVFGGSARLVPAKVLGFRSERSWWYVTVSLPEVPFEAEFSVKKDTFAALRENQAVAVVLHDGLFGDSWCRRDPIERAALDKGYHE